MNLVLSKESPRLRRSDFELLRKLIHERGCISLGDNKAAMLRARLGKLLRGGGHRSFRDYYQHVIEDTTGEALQELLNAVTTNKTEFFREADHLDLLSAWEFPAACVPRIWCAGCATGQEPYSLAMTIADRIAAPNRADILACDLSTRALSIAREGVYPEAKLAGIPLERLRRFFLRGDGSKTGLYKFKPQYASWIRFRHHNLQDPLQGEAPFDVIFCRNVLIYFDREFQQQLVSRFLAKLRVGGLLFLGHAESLTNLGPLKARIETVAPSVYRLRSH